jgi:OOP family OmpA-OmpF porin
MEIFIMRYFTSLLVFLTFFSSIFAQNQNEKGHPFEGTWVISGEAGAVLGTTDFPENQTKFSGRVLLEYFLPTKSKSVFGARLFGGAGYVGGKGTVSDLPSYSDINELRTEIVYGGGGIIYSLSLGKVVQPYLMGGISYLVFNPLNEHGGEMPRNSQNEYSKNDINYMGEIGIRFLVKEHFSFNLGYSLNYLVDDNIDDILTVEDDALHTVFGGVSFYFGRSSDSDKDGIVDSKDLCPNTPKGVSVDQFGCAIDSDNDKIPDYKDLCSDTPSNVEVDSNGCPVDLDSDGIADYLDNCPDSKLDAIVDEYGCEQINEVEEFTVITIDEESTSVEQIDDNGELGFTAFAENITERIINFTLGNAKLTKHSTEQIDRLANKMKEDLSVKWAIIGYADNIGSEDNNFTLSLQRADAIVNYLISKNIPKANLQVYGLGPYRPIADNSIEFGRALNRRAEVIELTKFAERNSNQKTIELNNYAFSEEYNVGSLIFTDGKYYCIQISSWKTARSAEKEVKKLIDRGHSAFRVEAKNEKNGEIMHRVRIGYFKNLSGARDYLNRIR